MLYIRANILDLSRLRCNVSVMRQWLMSSSRVAATDAGCVCVVCRSRDHVDCVDPPVA